MQGVLDNTEASSHYNIRINKVESLTAAIKEARDNIDHVVDILYQVLAGKHIGLSTIAETISEETK
jgi:hypothetical protein